MTNPSDRYLSLLMDVLLGLAEAPRSQLIPVELTGRRERLLGRLAATRGWMLSRNVDPPSDEVIETGLYFTVPRTGYTMMGRTRLANLRALVQATLRDEVAGDYVEAGVWRGGGTMLMKGILNANAVHDRQVVVADSFAGLPPPSVEFPADRDFVLHNTPDLAVGLEEVQANFERYGLLDDGVEFVRGWFRDTLPRLQDRKWALIRLDGDMYESTMDGLVNLYPGLSIGGYLVIDDHGAYDACRKAVEDYRTQYKVVEPLQQIDWSGVYWQKAG